MKETLILVLICVAVSLSAAGGYDYFVISPKLEENVLLVVDVDHILATNEQLVMQGDLSMKGYENRVKRLEKIIAEKDGMVINKYLSVGNKLYPLVFGGKDITTDIMKELEEAVK